MTVTPDGTVPDRSEIDARINGGWRANGIEYRDPEENTPDKRAVDTKPGLPYDPIDGVGRGNFPPEVSKDLGPMYLSVNGSEPKVVAAETKSAPETREERVAHARAGVNEIYEQIATSTSQHDVAVSPAEQ